MNDTGKNLQRASLKPPAIKPGVLSENAFHRPIRLRANTDIPGPDDPIDLCRDQILPHADLGRAIGRGGAENLRIGE